MRCFANAGYERASFIETDLSLSFFLSLSSFYAFTGGSVRRGWLRYARIMHSNTNDGFWESPPTPAARANSKRLGLAVSTRATEHFETFFSVQLESVEQMFYGTARDCEVTVRF